MRILTAASIVEMEYCGGDDAYHTVYKLRLRTGERVVVKAERTSLPTACTSIKWGSKLMANVAGPNSRVKILTQGELMAIRQAYGNILRNHNQRHDECFDATFAVGQHFVWVKMKFVPNLSTLDLHQRSYAEVTALYATIKNEDFWSGLGKVLAVDLFIGNFDRFDPDGNLANEGNIFLQEIGRRRFVSVEGLDAFSTQYARLESNLNDWSDGAQANFSFACRWDYLKTLTRPDKRNAYAQKVVGSIHALLVKKHRKGVYPLDGCDQQLAAGIHTGALELRRYLLSKIVEYERRRDDRMQRNRPAPAANSWARAQPRAEVVTRNNNRVVKKDRVPEGILARMRYIDWWVV